MHEMGKKLFRGKLLPGLLQKNGKHRVAHGGTAIVAAKELTLPFDPKQDTTALYSKHFEAMRCNACWVQVTRKIRALVFSIYAITGASSDQHIHDQNENMFADLLEVSSQFGDIPIIFAGDFQNEPLQYTCLSNAMRYGHWNDPLMQVNDIGEVTRPLTYSLDGSFSGAGDRNSSIDAILMNSIAMAALEKFEVVEIDQCQHRPLRATFKWHTITQKGFVHNKPAPLNCEKVPIPGKTHAKCDYSQRTEQNWHQNFAQNFDTQNSEAAWSCINDFCLQTLIDEGATWGQGPQERGKLPRFQEKTICPGQLPNGMVKTKALQTLFDLLNGMLELSHRLRRISQKPADWHITRMLCRRMSKQVHCADDLQTWPYFEIPTLAVLDANIRRLKHKIDVLQEATKQQRIQTWKCKLKESAESTKGYIFYHLKNKVSEDPPNLIADKQGNTIYQPNCAINEINSQWDDIFSANVLRSDPIDVLRVIWPYIQHEHEQFHEPRLQAEDLFCTIQKRKVLAAPGLDGWRTSDLQRLPIAAFIPVAEYFQALEENSEALARTLTTAKQVILNKNGLADPLQKRLITVLPALILSYTGTRFRQLQEWQSKALPPTILGAVSGRNMSTVANTIRLDIDHSASQNDSIVGVKLDKSKCFDRINPEYAATLFLAFGISKNIVAIFLKLYKGLKRHMFYKGWTTPNFTTAANGVAQGCSFSLLAVNVYSKVWSCMLQKLPEISHAAFIDDSYIWTRIAHVHTLRTALQITEQWDVLSGQQFNHEKSKVFASSRNARAQAKEIFPGMKACLEVDVLGTMLYTSDRLAYNFPEDKVDKILLDAKNIASLPLPVDIKAMLAGAKIIPQCSFTAGISKIPKKSLGKIQAEIANILWYGKPKWRAKWLVLSMVGYPHRIEPSIARAYQTVLDFTKFLASHPQLHPQIHQQIREEVNHKHSLLQGFREALNFFGFSLSREGKVAYSDCTALPVEQIDFRDIKHVLQHLSRNYCYQKTGELKRKDFKKPEGVFDFDLSMNTIKKKLLPPTEGIPLESYLLNHMVGCSATKDRLAAAKFIDESSCRFCQQEKESIVHIMLECERTKDLFGEEHAHELGANFTALGLVEHPTMIAKHRLQVNTNLPPPPQISHPQIQVRVWTDGSVLWNNVFWLQSAGYAVIGENDQIITSGPVKHWSLTSYTSELWAIVKAISTATTSLCIYTDCKTIVDQFEYCAKFNLIPPDCKHPAWWNYICSAFQQFSLPTRPVFQLFWIPSHCYENIPIPLITDEMARAAGTEVDHIRGNRKADFVAKDAAVDNAAVHPKDEVWLTGAITRTQTRMAFIGQQLGRDVECMKRASNEKTDRVVEQVDDSQDFFHRKYPSWLWNLQSDQCQLVQDRHISECPQQWPLDVADWEPIRDFLCGCKWFSHAEKSTAFVELAFLFLVRGFKLSDVHPDTTSFRQIYERLRKALAFLHRKDYKLFPGIWARCENKMMAKLYLRAGS